MHNGKDEQAIGALIVEMTEGFNRHNSKAATRMYSSDADLVTVRGEAFKGRAEFERDWQRSLQPEPKTRG